MSYPVNNRSISQNHKNSQYNANQSILWKFLQKMSSKNDGQIHSIALNVIKRVWLKNGYFGVFVHSLCILCALNCLAHFVRGLTAFPLFSCLVVIVYVFPLIPQTTRRENKRDKRSNNHQNSQNDHKRTKLGHLFAIGVTRGIKTES